MDHDELSKNNSLSKFKRKSIVITYLLWFFGGIFGAHHLYLNRDRHAFIWFCTLGGYFGIGWAFEVFKIPNYVKEVNEDKDLIEKVKLKLRKHRKPPFSTVRFFGQIMVGYLFGELIRQAIPEYNYFDVHWSFLHWLIPLGVALGVWTVGNIGRETGVLWHCLLASYISYPIRYYIYDESWHIVTILFITTLVFDSCSKQWRKNFPIRTGKCERFSILICAVLIYLSLWCGYFYFNGKVLDGEGGEIPVHEAIQNLLYSSMWIDLKETIYEFYKYSQHRGWYEVLKELFILMDESGLKNAYKDDTLIPQTNILYRSTKVKISYFSVAR